MRLRCSVNSVDILMLLIAATPFLGLWAISFELLREVLGSSLYLIYPLLCFAVFGFPTATCLYFYWRIQGGRRFEGDI